MKTFVLVAAVAYLATLLSGSVEAAAPDQHDQCQFWAESGECDNNSGYMLEHCATSCEKLEQQATNEANELEAITSFFNLSAHDIQGNLVDFSKFKGQVTIVVNVASYCGYTDEHYQQLVQLWSQVKDSGKVNILAFPCNQFGAQEPESNTEIFQFSLTKGVDFQMMSKVNVNGANASLVYKYLKKVAGPTTIGWNFATYYVVAPDGTVEAYSGVEPLQLKDLVLGKLSTDEL